MIPESWWEENKYVEELGKSDRWGQALSDDNASVDRDVHCDQRPESHEVEFWCTEHESTTCNHWDTHSDHYFTD